MKYTPAQLATADQNVAAITQDPASVAVMLTIAIDQLSQVKP